MEMRLVRLVVGPAPAILTCGSGILSMVRLGLRKLISDDGGRNE